MSFDNVTKVFTVSCLADANLDGSILAHSGLVPPVEVTWEMQTGVSPDADYFKAYVFGYSESMDVNSGDLYR